MWLPEPAIYSFWHGNIISSSLLEQWLKDSQNVLLEKGKKYLELGFGNEAMKDASEFPDWGF